MLQKRRLSKPAPMGWVHCAAVPPLRAGRPACMDDDWRRGRRRLVCVCVCVECFPFPKRGNWTKGSQYIYVRAAVDMPASMPVCMSVNCASPTPFNPSLSVRRVSACVWRRGKCPPTSFRYVACQPRMCCVAPESQCRISGCRVPYRTRPCPWFVVTCRHLGCLSRYRIIRHAAWKCRGDRHAVAGPLIRQAEQRHNELDGHNRRVLPTRRSTCRVALISWDSVDECDGLPFELKAAAGCGPRGSIRSPGGG